MLSHEWRERLGTVLWQLGYDPEVVDAQLDQAAEAGMTEAELGTAYSTLARELVLQHSGDAWSAGAGIAQRSPGGPGQGSPGQRMPRQDTPGQGTPPGPGTPGPGTPAPPDGGPVPSRPPGGNTPPPPGTHPVPPPGTDPSRPPDAGPLPPPPGPEPDDGNGSLAPWLIGAGLLGAGVLGAVAFHDGTRNVRALRATAAAFDSGAMHQGGLQAINDAKLGARFSAGIGLGSYLSVATPGLNRIGTAGRLTSVARGQLDHVELLAASVALRRGVGDAVSVHEPTRAVVLDGLEGGRSIKSVIGELERSGKGAGPNFDDKQLARYWDETSIVERGRRSSDGPEVLSGTTSMRPGLALERDVLEASSEGTGGFGRYRIVETGAPTRVDSLVAGRGARLGERGLASGVGTMQGVNVSTLHPAMQARAIAASGVDPQLVADEGLNAAFTARWRDRLQPPRGGPSQVQ